MTRQITVTSVQDPVHGRGVSAWLSKYHVVGRDGTRRPASSLPLCCGYSATARGTAGVLQCSEYGLEAEQAFPCTGPGDPQGIGVPRVSSSFDFWLFITPAGWGLSQCVFCLQCRVRRALPVWSISRPRTCSPRKSL